MFRNSREGVVLFWKKAVVGGTLCVALMGLSPAASAQQATAESVNQAQIIELRNQITQLQAQIEMLRRRLDELTNRPAAATPATSTSSATPQSSQPTQSAPAKEPSAQKPTYSLSYDDNGLSFRSSDGNFTLRSFIGFHGQFTAFTRSARENTTFSVRRIRPEFQGTVFKNFKYNFGFDLTGGGALLQNAYIDYAGFAKYTYIRVGQFKTPFGRETYEFSRLTQPFIERSNLFALTTIRNIGIGFGGVAAKRLKWDVAVVNGNGINGASALNDNDTPDFAGRASVNITKKLNVGGSFQIGREPLNPRGADTPTTVVTDNLFIFGGSLPANVLPPGTTATQGLRTRAGGDFRLDFALANKPAFLQGEYIHEAQRRENIPVGNAVVPKLPDLVRQGFMFQGGTFVTGGESRGLELLARFDLLDVDDKNDPVLAAAHPVQPGQLFGNPFNIVGNRMNTVTLGMNYWFNKRTRFQFNYYIQDLDRATTPNGGVGLSREGVSSFFLMQVQTIF